MIRSKVALILAIFVIGVVSAVAGYTVVERKNPVTEFTQMFVPTPQQVFGKSNLVVLVEGLDYDYNGKDEESSAESRSDVIWAVNLDLAHKRIYELSIPRDMIATMPNGAQSKINAAQSEGGVKEAKSVISKWLGIPGFDRYVILRIDATQAFIAALGGVDVNVKSSDCLRYKTGCTGEPLNYDDNWGHLHIHLKEGMQHLDGPQAVGYMRYREDWCSDPCRIMRQQQVLRALVEQARSNRVNTLMHLGNLLAVFSKYVETDFSDPQIVSLVTYFQGISPAAVVSAQVPYTGDINLPDEGDSLIPDAQARAKLVASMLTAPPLPIPSPDAMALAAIPASTLHVDVENGSTVSGAARRVAAQLKHAGFAIGEVGDADRSDYTATEIHEHSSVTFAGAKVRAALPIVRGVVVVPDPASTSPTIATSDVTVIVGSDLASNASPNL